VVSKSPGQSLWQATISISPYLGKFKAGYELGRWICVICAFNLFAFFGFSKEARKNYHAVYLIVAKHIGVSGTSSKPSYNPRPRNKKNDIEALVFAHTTNTNGKNYNANKKED
jgi:hypothetical protein